MGDERTALGNDPDCVVEMPKEREELLFGALGSIEVVGDERCDAV